MMKSMFQKSVYPYVLNVSFFLLATFCFSQDNVEILIPWENSKEIFFKDRKIRVPSIKNQSYENNKINFYWTQKLSISNHSELNLLNYQTTETTIEDVEYLKLQNISVSSLLTIDYKITNAGKEVYAVVNLFPYILENGTIRRISSLNFRIQPSQSISNKSIAKSYVKSSVLSSGKWYKIGVRADGICKIDKDFLESCGISTEKLNPQTINIYGNGDGKLPELNSSPRTDDLAKNAIYFSGESDGVFNDEDYILFYAWGPTRWYSKDANAFEQDKNIYSDISYYFINIDPAGTPLRISAINSTSKSVTDEISSYSYFDVHEQDLVSLVKGGQRWYGEQFDTQLEQVFNFSIPNIDPSVSATFEVSMAANSSGSGSTQKYSVNGNVLTSLGLPYGDYGRTVTTMKLSNPPSFIPLKISVFRNSPATKVYLDRITLNARRKLVFMSNQFNFRDLNSVGLSRVGNFTVTQVPSSIVIWDVTNRHIPKIVNGTLSGTNFSFQLETDSLREFVASDFIHFVIPEKFGFIENQNLHGLPQADYLIVTHSNFIDQANRLADLHRETGLKVHVVTTEQIFNEYSSGMLDPTAIRSFAKMFYDRAKLNVSSQPNYFTLTSPKYLLLFGDGTYDPKNRLPNNNNYVPTYQVLNSENHITALVTDDYYGFFDPSESIGASDLLDIGIGRLLISDNTIAKQQVDKIEHYMKNGSTMFSSNGNYISTFGDWRSKCIVIADDEENGYFVNEDAEPNSKFIKGNYPEMNLDKLYLDAYTQISNAGGQRYPDIYNSISDRVERGALIINYVGHGGETGVAEERVITIPQIQDWANINKLHLMVTATCEFTKYDDPERVSAGEWASLNPNGASIALMTTTRSVFFNVNTTTGSKFYEYVFSRDENKKPLTFGEIIRLTKNASGSSDNKRSFTLIGDPALRLALPQMKIVTDSINSSSPNVNIDTIKALSKLTIKGHVEDYSSNVMTNFNGVLSPTVFDKPKNEYTLGQDKDSPIIQFELQKNSLYKGKVSVKNGYFEFDFIVPKDIDYTFGKGKISYYAENGSFDAFGEDTRLIIGGVDPKGIKDDNGPQISMYLNDNTFVNGGICNENPLLIIDLFDENGINAAGNGVGHDLLAVIDGNSSKPLVLNEYYIANLDSYQSGKINYPLSKLAAGKHTLSVKAWDVNNNSAEANLEFFVQAKEELELKHVLNYPNPFTIKTEFYFEHNQVNTELETQIQIFTVSGKLVKTINQDVLTNGFRSSGIAWDGLDEYGAQLAKGVYVYRVKVKSSDGKIAEKTEKLVILK